MKMISIRRRQFIDRTVKLGALAGAGMSLGACADDRLSEEQARTAEVQSKELFFSISLAQWSLHRAFRNGLDNLEFAAKARSFDISAIEYVNQFFKDKAEDGAYLDQMNQRAADNGVKNIRIMIDGEGALAHGDRASRRQAVLNHHKWVRAAKRLGCQDIRVNARGKGDPVDVANYAVESLHDLAEYAAQEGMGIIIENHGGWSSDGAWLAGVMKRVNLPNCGTLPDFGNFRLSLFPPRQYDRYQGVGEMLPFALGASAKTYDFDASGEETTIDYKRMLNIMKQAGYQGYLGIEYEGLRLSEGAGIIATRNLLQRYGAA